MLPTIQPQHLQPLRSREVILIAEDYDGLHTYISNCLSPYFEIIESSNGFDAWQIASNRHPDLVIANLVMPQFSGMDLCRRIKQDKRTDDIPFIILTDQADMASKIEGLNEGADDCITKPFHVEELKARVNNLILARKRIQNHYAKEVFFHSYNRDIQSADERFLQRVNTVINENIDNTQFGVEMFAREVGLSSVQLYRKLHSLTGQSPNDFIRNIRLQQSAYLLEKKVGNVSEVAYKVGFSTLSYFSKCFREKFGCTPNEYAKNAPLIMYQSKVA